MPVQATKKKGDSNGIDLFFIFIFGFALRHAPFLLGATLTSGSTNRAIVVLPAGKVDGGKDGWNV